MVDNTYILNLFTQKRQHIHTAHICLLLPIPNEFILHQKEAKYAYEQKVKTKSSIRSFISIEHLIFSSLHDLPYVHQRTHKPPVSTFDSSHGSYGTHQVMGFSSSAETYHSSLSIPLSNFRPAFHLSFLNRIRSNMGTYVEFSCLPMQKK